MTDCYRVMTRLRQNIARSCDLDLWPSPFHLWDNNVFQYCHVVNPPSHLTATEVSLTVKSKTRFIYEVSCEIGRFEIYWAKKYVKFWDYRLHFRFKKINQFVRSAKCTPLRNFAKFSRTVERYNIKFYILVTVLIHLFVNMQSIWLHYLQNLQSYAA